MYLRSILLLTVLLYTCVLVGNPVLQNQSECNKITDLDFANMLLNVPRQGQIQFHEGKSLILDGLGNKNWECTITKDLLFSPKPSMNLRLIVITCNHLSGSGAWDNVLIYCCRNGKLVRIFQERFLYGARISKLKEDHFSLISGEWLKGDPMCCPSKERLSTYQWDEKEQTFIRINSKLRSRKE